MIFAVLPALMLGGAVARAQQVDTSLYSGLRWRLIGSFRGGRVTSVSGIPGNPTTFYMGTPGGGIWMTNDAGRTWKPIFDAEQVASIGALAIAQSNPKIIYAGTGEQTQGNGVYKSTDGGVTWASVGLQETHIIPAVVVDPKDPNLVVVAATGDRTSGAERGIYRSADGGKTWKKVLFVDDTTGAVALCADPGNPRTLYAALARGGAGPGGGGNFGAAAPPPAVGSQIFKSTDEGATWKALAGGLPATSRGKISVGVAAGNQGRRVFAIFGEGMYRSDDAGTTWRKITDDPRIVGGGYFSGVFPDPNNADILYVAQTSMYRSTDGGKTFEAFTGAPSGDDFHVMWIDPRDSRRMIMGVDQGAIISVNGGETWSSWYNQPTGQFYHASTDNQFPYHVYAAQQDSGTASVASRSDYGEISYRDWMPVGGFEDAHIAADPLDPNIVYTDGWYGTVLRFDRRTGQVPTVFYRGNQYRTASMAPLEFSPQDPHALYLGTQFVMVSRDAGMSWKETSPDLTVASGSEAANPPRGRGLAAINTLSLSKVQDGVIWAGTTNGLVQMTTDGGASWHDVTPPELPAGRSISTIEAGHYDTSSAYIAVTAFGDSQPYFYRTHDAGKTWQSVTAGLPENAIARVIREDPMRKGLLYAGTETSVHVSFDDGDHWQSLQLNLPASSMRDLVVHGDDLVLATYGRSLWILDDVTPLRQATAQVATADVFLYKPATAVRARWDMNQDTPFPADEPTAQNPPDGAILDYVLKTAPSSEISMAINDAQGNLVRQYSSVTPATSNLKANVPSYWFAPPAVLSKAPGMHRFVWNLRYASPKVLPYNYYGVMIAYTEYTLADHAIPGETPREQPEGPLVAPGEYTAALTVNGQTIRRTFQVIADPRVRISQADFEEQLDWARRITDAMGASFDAFHQIGALGREAKQRLEALSTNPQAKEAADAVRKLDEQAAIVAEGTRTERGIGAANRDLNRLFSMVESGDMRPSEPMRAAVTDTCRGLAKSLAQWRELNGGGVALVNAQLAKFNLSPLPVAAEIPADPACGK